MRQRGIRREPSGDEEICRSSGSRGVAFYHDSRTMIWRALGALRQQIVSCPSGREGPWRRHRSLKENQCDPGTPFVAAEVLRATGRLSNRKRVAAGSGRRERRRRFSRRMLGANGGGACRRSIVSPGNTPKAERHVTIRTRRCLVRALLATVTPPLRIRLNRRLSQGREPL